MDKSIVSGIFKVQWSRLLLSQPVCAETKENETAKSTDHSGGKIKNEKECAVAGR